MELSSPEGKSVKYGIRKEWFSLVYASVDNIVKIIQGLDCGALMAKVDDHYLLGMQWEGKLYIDSSAIWSLFSSQNIQCIGRCN